MRRAGSWPSTKAGRQTEAQMDLRLRGGTVMISRRVSALDHRLQLIAMASRCQFGSSRSRRHDRKRLLDERVEVSSDDCRSYLFECWAMPRLPGLAVITLLFFG